MYRQRTSLCFRPGFCEPVVWFPKGTCKPSVRFLAAPANSHCRRSDLPHPGSVCSRSREEEHKVACRPSNE